MAAFVGVAATGAAIARAERQRRAYTPDQVRDRLHARAAEIREVKAPGAVGAGVGDDPASGRHSRGRARGWTGRVAALPPVAAAGRLWRRVRRR
ncbi:hypothetical protein [Nocardiopsis sp. MG754419]|uniref:hypothetical protein n=1 Tax=Nocardiopsis sp. MG754419 TaxID=2259865 RepID=UPI001BAB1FE0|nr:hypothetical protein [Nocardiopsis sp. MG754419]MBR8743981.1 hypothetical protein [Nocardiopsis sp. MG754419]